MNSRAEICQSSLYNREALAVQVTGFAVVGLGVWLHVKGDSLFYTHLVRVSPRATGAASSVVPSPSTNAVHSSSAASSTTSSPTPPMLSTDVISVDSWPFFMMAAGSCVTLVGFLGCCGACTESVCFLSFVRTSQLTDNLNNDIPIPTIYLRDRSKIQ